MKHSSLLVPLLPACLASAAACGTRDVPQTAKEPVMSESTPPPETAPAPTAPAPTWSVWDKSFKVLTIVGRPGPIISMAAPPGPAKLQNHAFLSATSSSPIHEDRLRRLLLASKSLDEYLQALRDAGFRVQEEAPTP